MTELNTNMKLTFNDLVELSRKYQLIHESEKIHYSAMTGRFYGPDYIKSKYGQAALDAYEEDQGIIGWDRLTASRSAEDAEDLYNWADCI